MRKSFWTLTLMIISLIGMVVSSYLEYVSSQPICPVGFGECYKVIASPYSKVYGVTLSSLGLVWFLVLLLLTIIAFYKHERITSYLVFGWALISIPSVAVLAWIEVVILNTICVYCTIAHILAVISIVPAYKISRIK